MMFASKSLIVPTHPHSLDNRVFHTVTNDHW